MSESWSRVIPKEEGTYAILEAWQGPACPAHLVCKVERVEGQEGLFYGMRRVEDAPPGTLWHKISDVPEGKLGPIKVVISMADKKITGIYTSPAQIAVQVLKNWWANDIIDEVKVAEDYEPAEGLKALIVVQDGIVDRCRVFESNVQLRPEDVLVDVHVREDYSSDEHFAELIRAVTVNMTSAKY